MSDCICDKSLTEYVMVYVKDPSAYVNSDFIREHGVIVDFAAREHPLLRNNDYSDARIVYAFTIAEVYRLIEQEQGGNREPLHRILNEDREVIHKCCLKDATIESVRQAAMDRFLNKYDARLS